MMTRALRPLAAGLAALVMLAACKDDVLAPLELSGAPSDVSLVSGNQQTGPVGTLLGEVLVVRVTDDQGRPTPAVEVRWNAVDGTVSVTRDSTDENGESTVSWTLPTTIGTAATTATVTGLGTVSFSASVTPPNGNLVFRYIDAGSYHGCGITTTEELYCWGYNGDGQLGVPASQAQPLPAIVPSVQRFRTVTGGRYHTCGLTFSGESHCWGSDHDGRLGLGADWWVTSQVVQAGETHTCSISLARRVYCWGWGGEGQLGWLPLPDPPFSQEPDSVSGSGLYRSVSAGGVHTCGIRDDGRAYCWGFNRDGQLGNADSTNLFMPDTVATTIAFRVDPALVPPSPDPDFPLPPGPFISAGYHHTCAIAAAGSTYCWGLNQDGQLGNGGTALSRIPVAVAAVASFVRITSGRRHSCGITSAGVAYCWGDNTFGQLGDGTFTQRFVPTPVAGGMIFAYLKAGDLSTCGVTTAGVGYCWGDNEYGQLGTGNFTNASQPAKIAFQQ